MEVTGRTTVVVVGPFPPPVHGMAKNTALIAEELRARCNLIVADISPGTLVRSARYHATKIAKVVRALAVLLSLRARTRDPRLYIPADAGFGTYYTIAIVALARCLGYRIFIHHRSFAYIDKRRRRMAVLARCAGAKAVHVFLCPEMERRFRDHYPHARRGLRVSNAHHVDPIVEVPERANAVLKLGHLSNLGPEKGLDQALETLRRLAVRNVSMQLVLAGPPGAPKVAGQIEAAKRRFGELLEYRGAVYGRHKDQFYRDIDVFLFPTRYVHEAQPNVVLEAMSYGVPTISYARGCVADLLSGGGGIPVARSDDFADASLPILIDWAENSESLIAARRKALARAIELKRMADEEFMRLIEMLCRAQEDPPP